MKSQTKANKAFMEKVQSITIGTGAKAPKCGICGGKLVGMAIGIRRIKKSPKQNDEQSFAA